MPIILPEQLPANDGESLGADFGQRDGPCTIEYRQFNTNHHPTYITHSCLGCSHVEVSEFLDAYCNHPEYLQKYGSRQYIGCDYQRREMLKCHSHHCPALASRAQNKWPLQPPPSLIDRSPEYRTHPINDPFKAIPIHHKTAFLLRIANL